MTPRPAREPEIIERIERNISILNIRKERRDLCDGAATICNNDESGSFLNHVLLLPDVMISAYTIARRLRAPSLHSAWQLTCTGLHSIGSPKLIVSPAFFALVSLMLPLNDNSRSPNYALVPGSKFDTPPSCTGNVAGSVRNRRYASEAIHSLTVCLNRASFI